MSEHLARSRVLSARDRRAIRTGAAIATPVLFFLFIAKPYILATHRAADALQAQRLLLQREEDITVAARGSRVDSMAAAAARHVTARTYDATDTVLALTAFSRDVAAALKDAGLAIQRVETRDSVARHAGLQELTIDVRAQGDFESVLNALARLEGNDRLIHVSRLAIERSSGPSPNDGSSLSLAAVMHAYAR